MSITHLQYVWFGFDHGKKGFSPDSIEMSQQWGESIQARN